jgi:5'-nucleotidase
MKILLVNDDGIYSDGIHALWKTLSEQNEVTVVAPLEEQSATGHAITLFHPLRIEQVSRRGGFTGWGVTGTPADCVKIALSHINEGPPFEALISGINRGFNTSNNILYSGTVSAAAEGYMAGIPSLAVSTAFHYNRSPEIARFISLFLPVWAESPFFKERLVLNVNYPDLPLDRINGVRFTRQGSSFTHTRLVERTDPMGEKYYWFSGHMVPDEEGACDDGALMKGYVSITPLKFDLTDYKALDKMRALEEPLWKKLKS